MIREELLSLFFGNRGVDDDIVTLLPIDGGGDAVFFTNLKSYTNGSEYKTRVRQLFCTHSRRP